MMPRESTTQTLRANSIVNASRNNPRGDPPGTIRIYGLLYEMSEQQMCLFGLCD